MAQPTIAIAKQPAYQWAALCLFTTVAIILGALAFEFIGGFQPCPLCLQQRYAYYVAIPLLFVAMILLSSGPRQGAIALLFFCSMIFLANAAFGVYHAGGEWGYWPLPATCSATGELSGGGANLLKSLQNAKVPECGKPELIILGLSLAGWNAVVSTCLTVGCLKAAFYAADPAPVSV
jgi:disulfide bond formation protein DsbB